LSDLNTHKQTSLSTFLSHTQTHTLFSLFFTHTHTLNTHFLSLFYTHFSLPLIHTRTHHTYTHTFLSLSFTHSHITHTHTLFSPSHSHTHTSHIHTRFSLSFTHTHEVILMLPLSYCHFSITISLSASLEVFQYKLRIFYQNHKNAILFWLLPQILQKRNLVGLNLSRRINSWLYLTFVR